MFTVSSIAPLRYLTVPFLLTCTIGNGPRYLGSNFGSVGSAVINILSPTEYVCLILFEFSLMLFSLISFCFLFFILSQSAVCWILRMASLPYTSCIGDFSVVVLTVALMRNAAADNIPVQGLFPLNPQRRMF